MERSAGILLHISSLPSKWGIGTLGKEAYKFADFLNSAGQTYWQILPIGPTSYGDSPYQALSMYAGNPYFIDLDLLTEEGLLSKSDYDYIDWGKNDKKVDFGKIYKSRFKVLKIAYKNRSPKHIKKFNIFKTENKDWLNDYALFMSLKDHFDGKSWVEWPDADIRFRKKAKMDFYKDKLKDDIDFWCFIQYLFFKQWNDFKAYVNSKNIKIIGDIPIYVAMDSADIWANPENFWLDEDLKPVCVAGCPPDSFSPTGQLWGNPLYNWEYLKKSEYKWWIDRVKQTSKLFDVTRIDHFRGFESFYSIPANEDTAINGDWIKGPGFDFFKKLNKQLGNIEIIAEDLGFISEEVKQLIKATGYPGMKILVFAFDSGVKNIFLPHHYEKNCIVYTGTHDNDTVKSWLKSAPKDEKDFAISYCRMHNKNTYTWSIIQTAYASVANLAIIQMQDILNLGKSARMNEPSTLGKNWQWRMKKNAISNDLISDILKITKLYDRFIPTNKEDTKNLKNNKQS